MAIKKHAVMEAYSLAATNIDSKVQNFKSEDEDFDNGNVLTMGDISKKPNEWEVFEAKLVDTSETGEKTYMAFDAIEIITVDGAGNEYKLDQDNPTAFTNTKGRVFTAFQPTVGDKINLSEDGFTTKDPGSNTFATVQNGEKKLVWGTSAGSSGLAFELVHKHYIIVPQVNMMSHRIPSYVLRCVSV